MFVNGRSHATLLCTSHDDVRIVINMETSRRLRPNLYLLTLIAAARNISGEVRFVGCL
jgi:hypothetical protein